MNRKQQHVRIEKESSKPEPNPKPEGRISKFFKRLRRNK